MGRNAAKSIGSERAMRQKITGKNKCLSKSLDLCRRRKMVNLSPIAQDLWRSKGVCRDLCHLEVFDVTPATF